MSAKTEMLKANLLSMIEKEETDPAYYGKRIADICERMGW